MKTKIIGSPPRVGRARNNSRANKRTKRALALEKAKIALTKTREAEKKINQILARKPTNGPAKTERAKEIAVLASQAAWQAKTLAQLSDKNQEDQVIAMALEAMEIAEKVLKISEEAGHVVCSKTNCIIPANKAWMIQNEQGIMTGFMARV